MSIDLSAFVRLPRHASQAAVASHRLEVMYLKLFPTIKLGATAAQHALLILSHGSNRSIYDQDLLDALLL